MTFSPMPLTPSVIANYFSLMIIFNVRMMLYGVGYTVDPLYISWLTRSTTGMFDQQTYCDGIYIYIHLNDSFPIDLPNASCALLINDHSLNATVTTFHSPPTNSTIMGYLHT